jgi:hypothetical protein
MNAEAHRRFLELMKKKENLGKKSTCIIAKMIGLVL